MAPFPLNKYQPLQAEYQDFKDGITPITGKEVPIQNLNVLLKVRTQ